MVKKMTNREKKQRAAMKKEMQSRGILPPDKPKLNRKKYIDDAINEWNGRDEKCYVWDIYMQKALNMMLAHRDNKFRISLEAVGAAKILRLAIRLEAFHNKLKSEGREEYTLVEQYEYIKDILEE